MSQTTLRPEEHQRYARQMMLDGWGEETQRRLKDTTVFVAGAGGLGSPVAMYLAVAGVGHIRLCDFDAPEYSNLNRQILHDPSRIGVNKAVSGQQTLATLNPDVEVIALPEMIDENSVERLVGDATLILDCMDNFPTRYLLNRLCIARGIPMVHGSVWGLEGRVTFLHPPRTPCLRCMVPDAPPKETFPVVGATPGVIGSLQVVEALKYLTGRGQLLEGRLLSWDGLAGTTRSFRLRHDPSCPDCAAARAAAGDTV